MGRRYRIISADGHVETPPDPWVRHVPERYRDRAPRLIHLPGGDGDAWLVEGKPMLHTGQNITGPGPVKFAHGSYTRPDGSASPGTGDAVQRLREQDQDGIDAEVLYPPVFVTGFIEGIEDRDVYLSIVQAYNTFLAEDYCSVAPDRLIGVAFMPITGIDDALGELERAHRLGLRAVMLKQFPNGTGKLKPEDDRFFEKVLELKMAFAPHINFGDAHPVATARHDTSLWPAPAGMAQHAHTNTPGYTIAQLICGGVFERFPDLRLYFAEANCCLIPGMMYYMDRDFTEYNDWFKVTLPMLPSEYVAKHCYFGMIQERPAIKMGLAGLLPLDRFLWASDFPHSVGTFPNSHQYIDEAFDGVDEATLRKVLCENAADFFGLDIDKDITETPAQLAS